MERRAIKLHRLRHDFPAIERCFKGDEAVTFDTGETDAALLFALVRAGVRAVPIQTPAVIKAQFVAHCDGVVVCQREIETVPTANRPDRKKRPTVAHAREVHAVAAHSQLHVERAVIGRGVKDLHQTDVKALV